MKSRWFLIVLFSVALRAGGQSVQQLDRFMDQLQKGPNAVTHLETNAIYHYTGEAFGPLNNALRLQEDREIGSHRTMICTLDRVFEKAALPMKNLKVYRGHSFLPENWNKIGHEFTLRAYSSTSLDVNVARRFAGYARNKASIIDVITVPNPELKAALWVDYFSAYRQAEQIYNDYDKGEDEVLLARGLRVRVKSVETKKGFFDRSTYRHLEVIGIDRYPVSCP